MLSQLSVAKKLNVFLLAALLALVAVTALSLYSKRESMLEDRRIKIKNVVELGVGVLDYYEKLAQSGKMPRAEAQELAKRTIGNLRYDEKEYYSLYDMGPKMVWHPIKPELIGKDLSTLKDPTGKLLVVEMRDLVEKQGGGFVEYLWPQPGKEKPVPKLAYAGGFKAWGWIVASGIYIDDVNEQFFKDSMALLAEIGLVALLLGFLAFSIQRNLVGSIGALQTTMDNAHSNNDLSLRAQIEGNDEVAQAARSFNSLLEGIQATLKGVWTATERVTEQALQLSNSANSLSQASSAQGQAISSSSAALEEISASMEETVEQSARVATIAHGNVERAQTNQRTLVLLKTKVDQASEVLEQHVSASVQNVARSMDSIQKMTQEVREIADQTNLLALNAAIESARAGEVGRGFAVVADEVRKLAEKSALSAAQIDEVTQTLLAQTQHVQSHVQTGQTLLEESQQTANAVVSILEEASHSAHDAEQNIGEMRHALNEQKVATQQIQNDVGIVATHVDKNYTVVMQTVEAAQTLDALASSLKQEVGRFKL